MAQVKLQFRHDGHVTKRNYRFAELDEDGRMLDKVDAKIGSIYVKKKLFDQGGGAVAPDEITITLEW